MRVSLELKTFINNLIGRFDQSGDEMFWMLLSGERVLTKKQLVEAKRHYKKVLKYNKLGNVSELRKEILDGKRKLRGLVPAVPH